MSNKEFLISIINEMQKEQNNDSKNWRGTITNWIKC